MGFTYINQTGVLLLLTTYCICVSASCKHISNLSEEKCKCQSIKPKYVRVECSEKSNFNNLKFLKSNITILELHKVNLDYLKRTIFTDIKLKKLILYNVDIYLMTDLDVPASGINANLQKLEIYNSDIAFTWKWQHLRLSHVTHVTIDNGKLYYLGHLDKLKKLKFIQVVNSDISWVDENVFADLQDLHLLCLRNDGLKKIERSFFPRPASKLWHLDLSYNNIHKLPENMFTDMPKLMEVKLDHNKLKVLPEKVIKPVLSQLTELWIHANRLECVEELCWTIDSTLPMFTVFDTCFASRKRASISDACDDVSKY